MTFNLLLEHFDAIADSPGGVARLRALILQLAVRGMLVPQDPNDEPASMLLERIRAEQRRTTNDGGRTTKEQPPIIADEVPFALPNGWEWTHFDTIVDFRAGKTPSTKDARYWSNNGSPWISISDMEHYGVIQTTTRCITPAAEKETFKDVITPAGTLLMSFKLTIGKVSILGVDAYHNEAIISIYPKVGVSQAYLYRFLPILATQGNTKNAIKGSTLNKESLSCMNIPLPPLAEQRRIVARVDALLALCDALDARQTQQRSERQRLQRALLDALIAAADAEAVAVAWQRLADSFDMLHDTPDSVAPLRQTVLQLAVQGRLVAQDAADEPASVLLERIRAAKAQRNGNEKQRHAERSEASRSSTMNNNEPPFALPRGWEWATLADVLVSLQTGPFGSNLHKEDYIDSGIPVINPASIKNEQIVPIERMTISSDTKARLSEYTLYKGDIILGRRGEMGRCAAITEREEGWLCGTGSLILRFDEQIWRPFVIKFFASDLAKSYLLDSSVGSTMNNLNQRILLNLPFPLPPLAEQRRIVARVDELMALCDALEAGLRATRAAAERLAAALAQR